MDKHELSGEIKRKALELGYARVGITTTAPFPEHLEALKAREGYGFLKAQGDESEFVQAMSVLPNAPGAKSVIVLVYSYGHISFPPELLQYAGRTYLSRCYWAPKASVNGQRLELFLEHLRQLGVKPLLNYSNKQLPDRALAARAGLVTYGKNNFAYADELGSFIIITTVPVDVELDAEEHPIERPCPEGCDRCVRACPTGAMAEDGSLDPTRCVLYNNFMPDALRGGVDELLGLRVHGCDECQTACPRNATALAQPQVKDPFLEWLKGEFSLERLLFMDDAYYARCVEPVMYNYIRNPDFFRRNAAIAMGNSGDAAYIPALERAAREGSESVRAAAKRSLQRLRAEG